MEFKDRVAVVTGGAKGIGQATADAFLRAGARVAVLDVDEPTASSSGAIAIQCDVSSGEQVTSAFAQIQHKLGDVDLLINNAGIQHYGTVTETSEQEWDRVLAINLKSAFLCAKA